MITPYTAFVGCSYTQGIGLIGTEKSSDLWVNILYQSTDLSRRTRLINLGLGGCSNIEIFQNAIHALATYDCKNLFVCWTSLYRYRFALSAETYTTCQYWSPTPMAVDITVNPGVTYTAKYLNDIKNKFFSLHHDHYEILKILNYTAALDQICRKMQVDVYFINNILPWDIDFFNRVTEPARLPSHTTAYTQQLFNAQTRDDDEFFIIYDSAHEEYQNTHGLTDRWLNLDRGFRKNFVVDYGNDDLHPGPTSHINFGQYLVGCLQHQMGRP